MPLTLLLHGKHTRSGAEYQPLGAWLVPWRLASFEQEYRTLRTGVGLIDYSTQGLIEVRGRDRASFLQALLTNDVARLKSGQGCRAALLDATGKIQADLLVVIDADAIWLICGLDQLTFVVTILEKYHFSEDVQSMNRERAQAVFALQGPDTMKRLTQLSGASISLPTIGDHIQTTMGNLSVRVVRCDLTDVPGVLLMVDAEHAHALWGDLQPRLQLVGWNALNTARIEAGVPWFGIDMDTTNLLPETGLEDALASETKGCYLGQEIIARMRTYGSANKKLMGLLLSVKGGSAYGGDGDVVPQAGDGIVRAGETVGRITSGCDSPMLRRPIAMGYVKRGAYEPGTAVEIVRGDHRLAATVVTRPLVLGVRPQA